MGIRINRRLGYAITDQEYDRDNWEHVDPRLNLDLVNDNERFHDIKHKFVEWVQKEDPEKIETILEEDLGLNRGRVICTMMGLDEIKDVPFHDVTTHAAEYGMPNVFLFQPISHPEWTRHDDTIDFYDSLVSGGQENRLVKLKEEGRDGIYPYEDFYYRHPDKTTPDKFLKKDVPPNDRGFGIIEGKLTARTYSVLVGSYKKGAKAGTKGELLEHFQNDWNVHIPADIRLFCHWSGIFNDPNGVFRLEPVLYEYWG